jgi:uncharacterized protein (DUF305 family)
MMTKIFPMIVIALIVSASTAVREDLHQAMMKMMQKMKSMKMTGDADHNFAMMMAEHHQGSIDAAEIVTKSGKDEKIKSLAKSMLSKQPQEQKQLRAHKLTQQDHSAHATSENAENHGSAFSSEMKQIMSEMETGMNNMKMTNNVDHDFAMMMVPHHQSAIGMADAILKHGKDNEIKRVAEKIKSDSQKEMNELKTWLQNHGK